ncbi:MAG TPA: hypothetical protein VL749_01710 [Patescibacteria group bacterium]|nr:hypothetical protein [Patescibacteria group bacterium]
MDGIKRPAGAARVVRTVVAASLVATFAIAGAVHGATLNPPPPAYYSCHASGNGTICVANLVTDAQLQPADFTCGEGASAFDVWDDGRVVITHLERWYDGNGNLVRRLAKATWLGSAWQNLANGNQVPYHQNTVTVDELTAPGDFGSAVTTMTGVVTFTLPSQGAIVLNAGRVVYGTDGSVEFRSGPQAFLDYFVDGDLSALQPVCDALA